MVSIYDGDNRKSIANSSDSVSITLVKDDGDINETTRLTNSSGAKKFFEIFIFSPRMLVQKI